MDNNQTNGIDNPIVTPVDTNSIILDPINALEEVAPVEKVPKDEEEDEVIDISKVTLGVNKLSGPEKASTFDKVKYKITEYFNPDKVELTDTIKEQKISWLLYLDGVREPIKLIDKGKQLNITPVIKDNIKLIPILI